jgi:A/G-specific adenine glycosylase
VRDETRDLLGWYDRQARDLPWRVGPAARAAGQRPDPYRVWLSEIMLQQTTVAAVGGYYARFLDRWPTVADLAAAEPEAVMAAWAGLGYYARARNLLACAGIVANDLAGRFPEDEPELRALPGIGPYTAAAIAAIAFDRPATVVDGNVERVVARLFAVETPLPDAKSELRQHAAGLTPQERPGDFAQAMMDLGATICTPRTPACGICPLRTPCRARALGLAAELPRRRPRAAKPVRQGLAWVGRREDGLWLLERRPEKGLLGGMLGWPGSEWGDAPEAAPPAVADWSHVGAVRHTFTHFHLVLQVHAGSLPRDAAPARGAFRSLDPAALPTLMRKAHVLAVSALGG